MAPLSFDRYCAEIVAQTELLASCLDGADAATRVPSCPEWNLSELLRHVGRVHRWAEETVRTRATGPQSMEQFQGPASDLSEDIAALGGWLVEGATRLADALNQAGPDTQLWTPIPGGTSRFYARRFTNETAIHRADAALALGAPYQLDNAIARDALDEWMELGSMAMDPEQQPWVRELLGPGRTLHLHATDTEAADWFIDLTGDSISWRHGGEPAAVEISGPLTDVLLLVLKRLPADIASVKVSGDTQLFEFWLERIRFG